MSLFSFGKPRVARAIPYDENLWIGVAVLSLLTVAILGYGSWWTWQNHLFADHARQLEATVIQKYVAESPGRHGTIYTPHIQYSYRVGNLVVNCDLVLNRYLYDQVQEGPGMPIKYLPEDPVNNRPDDSADDYEAMLKANVGLIAGLVALVVTIIWAIGAIGAMHRKKVLGRLKTVGLSARANVVSVGTVWVQKRKQSFLRIEFTDNFGQVFSGRTPLLTASQEKHWSHNKTVSVLYDPADSCVFTVNLSGE